MLVICRKCCWKLETVAQLSSVKTRFCETSQISEKTSKMVFLFCKTVSSQACNCYTKKDTITGVFLWIYLCEYIFSFLLLCFRKNRSSHRRCSVKKGVLKSFADFTRKHLCGSLFLIIAGLACNFIKKRLPHRCFPVEFAKYLRTPILNICEDCF